MTMKGRASTSARRLASDAYPKMDDPVTMALAIGWPFRFYFENGRRSLRVGVRGPLIRTRTVRTDVFIVEVRYVDSPR
jgi:hypothetical protein